MAPAVAMPSFLVPLLSALAFLLVLGVSWLAYGCCTRKPRITRALDTQGHLIQKNNTSLYNSNKNKHNTLLAGPEYPKSVFGHSYESLSDISEDGIPNPYINDNDDDDEAVYENQSNRGRLDLSFRFPPSRRHQPQTHETTPYNPPATTTSLSPLDTLSPRRPSPNGSTYFPRARTNTHSRSRSEHHRNQRKSGYTTIQDQGHGQAAGRSKSKPTPKPIPIPTPTHAPAQLGNKKSWWSWFGLRGRRRDQFRAGKEYASEGMTTKMMMATPGKVGIAERGMGMGMEWSKGDSGEEEEEGQEEEETRRFRSRSRSRSRSRILKTPASASSHSVFYSASSSLASTVRDPGPGVGPSQEHGSSIAVPRTPRASGSRTTTPVLTSPHAHTPTRTPTSTTTSTTTSGLNKRKGHVRAPSDVDFDLVDHTTSHSDSDSNLTSSLSNPQTHSHSKNHHYHTPQAKQHHRRGQSYVIVQHTPRLEAPSLDASSDGDGDSGVLDGKMNRCQGQDRDRDSMQRPGPDSLTDPPRMGQVQGSVTCIGDVNDMVRGVREVASAHHHQRRHQRRYGPGSTLSPDLPRPRKGNEDRSPSPSRGLSLYMSSRQQSGERGRVDVDDEEQLPSPPPLVNANVKRRAKNTHSRSDALVQGVPATILLHKGKEGSRSKVKPHQGQGTMAALHHSRAMRITRRYTQPTFTDRTSGVGEAEGDGEVDDDEERTQHRQRLDFKRAQTDPTPFPISATASPSRCHAPRKTNSRSRSRSRGFLGFGSRSRFRSGHGDESDEEYDHLPPSPTGTPTRASWERTVAWMNMGSSGGAAGARKGTMAQSGGESESGAHERGRTKANSGSGSEMEIMELEASGVLSAQFFTRGGRQVKPGSSQVVEGGELQGEGDDGWSDASLSMVMAGRDRDRKPPREDMTLIPASLDPSSRSRLDNGPVPVPPHPRTSATSSTPIVTTSSSPSGTAFYTSTPIEKPKPKLQSKRDRSSPSLSPSSPRAAGTVAVAPSSDSILNLVDKIMLWDGTSLEFPDD